MVSSEVIKSQQVGLMLPDGHVVWSPETYKGLRLDSPQDRWALVQKLKLLSSEISFIESELLDNYAWVVRDVFTTQIFCDPVTVPIQHEALVKEPELNTDEEETGETRDSGQGAIRNGEGGMPRVVEDLSESPDQSPTLGGTDGGIKTSEGPDSSAAHV